VVTRDAGAWRWCSARGRFFGVVRTALYALGGLAIIVFFVVRQRRSDRYRERSLILPLGLGLYGLALLRGTLRHDHLTAVSVVLLVLSGLASVGFGVFRGRTINLFVRDTELWEQASWRTIGVGWGGLLVTRVVLIGVAGLIGARLAASPTSIPLMIAITLAAQMLVVGERARAFDVPVAATGRRRRHRRGG
jgi:hypothetical protein